jgi:hypothetical protein
MLDNVRSGIDRRAIVAGVVGLVLGCLFGWMVLGWAVFPVTWTNADPWDLRPEQKGVYIALVADSYDTDQDADLARQRLTGFDKGELADTLATLVEEAEKAGDSDQKRRLQYLATVLDMTPSVATPTPAATPQPGTRSLFSSVRSLVPLCGLALVLLVIAALIAVIVFRLLRPRALGKPRRVAREERAKARELGPQETLGPFVTTYDFGDDGYDTSFNIETPGPGGEFYGACGVGFSEVLGEGSPDKIAAFEVWLFDKTDMDDVRTVTKVLMSEFAYNSQVLRDKMRDRGEAVLAERGKAIIIDGVGLQLRAEVVDFQYGADPSLSPNSYFQKLTTQLVPVLNP